MAIFATFLSKLAFLFSCIRPSNGRDTVTPQADDLESEATSVVNEGTALLSDDSLSLREEDNLPAETPCVSAVSSTQDLDRTVPSEPHPDPNPDPGPGPTHEHTPTPRAAPLWARPKAKEAENIPRNVAFEDSSHGASAPELYGASRCRSGTHGMAFLYNQEAAATVQLERLVLLRNRVIGYVTVANLAYCKEVYVRCTFDGWKSFKDTPCQYHCSDGAGQRDTFTFQLSATGVPELCICYTVQGQSYWDNNSGRNYSVLH